HRQFRDYNTQLARESQDAARTMLEPYQRLMSAQVFSTQDLLGNAAEQNKQMQTQLVNLSKARKMGVSQQTIDWLGLQDPNNAQQLAQMINDMMSDPKLAHALNASAKTRQGLAGSLFTQGLDYRRQKADFEK